MCGRYVSTASLTELAEAYGVDEIRTESLGARYNVAPSQPVYAVVARRPPPGEGSAGGVGPLPATRRLGALRWGLVPSWAKDRSIGNKLINARSEGIAAKPAFRSALLRRRCIIPADSFYEWQVQPAGPGGTKRGRRPYVICRRDRRPLSFAGLWEVWRDPAEPEAEPLRTATIVTTAANDVLAGIHSRMPVVLAEAGVATWLDPDVEDPEVLTGLLVPAPNDWWETWAVGTRVNAVANEGPELIEALPD
jgi:putative SOS response-associated peptidase YedK